MRTGAMIVLAAALACAGCGESRLPSGVTGGGTGGIGGAGNTGGAGCHSDTTAHLCMGQSSAPIILNPVVNVASTRTLIHVAMPVEYLDTAGERAQAFEVWLQDGAGNKFFFHPNGACPVVPDIPGLTGVRLRDLGNLTGLPPGQYMLMARHGLQDPCYTPPTDADTSQSNYLVFDTGTVTVCN